MTTVNYSYCVTNCGVVDGGYRERKFREVGYQWELVGGQQQLVRCELREKDWTGDLPEEVAQGHL